MYIVVYNVKGKAKKTGLRGWGEWIWVWIWMWIWI